MAIPSESLRSTQSSPRVHSLDLPFFNYIKDLPKNIFSSYVNMYADDATVYRRISNTLDYQRLGIISIPILYKLNNGEKLTGYSQCLEDQAKLHFIIANLTKNDREALEYSTCIEKQLVLKLTRDLKGNRTLNPLLTMHTNWSTPVST